MSEGGALREMVAWLGFEVDDHGLKKAEEGINKTMESAKKLAEAVILAFGIEKIGEFIHSQIEAGAQLQHTSEMLGISTGDLQAFQFAAETVGVSTDEASNALRFLNRTMGEAAAGNAEAAQEFAKLGVHIKDASGHMRPTADIIADVADGFQKLPGPAQQTAVAMKIFGRAGATMIPLLKKGSKGIDELYGEFKQLGEGMDEDFIKHAEEAEHQMVKLKTAGKGLSSTVADALLPTLISVVDYLTMGAKWMREVAKRSNILKVALWSLVGVSGVLAAIWAVMNIEIFAVIAAIALLVLGVEDFYTWLEGGDSVIGRFLDSLLGIGASQSILETYKQGWKDIWAALQDVWTALDNELGPALKDLANAMGFDGEIDGLKSWTDAVHMAINAVVMLTEGLATAVHYAAELAKFGKNLVDHPANTIVGGLVGGMLPGGSLAAMTGSGGAEATTPAGGGSLVTVPASTIAGGASAAGPVTNQNQNQMSNDITINVQGGKVNSDTAKSVREGALQALQDILNSGFAGVAGGGG